MRYFSVYWYVVKHVGEAFSIKFIKTTTLVVIMCCCFVLFPLVLFASNDAIQPQLFIEQQKVEQQRWLERHQYLAPQKMVQQNHFSLNCLPYSGLYFVGVTLIDTTAFSPALGECLSEARLNKLSRDLTSAYLAKGYIHNPFQFEDDGSGLLRLHVKEGKLINIRTESKRINPRMLFPNALGRPLRIYQLDQALDQANKMQNVNASVDVLPTKHGDIELVVVNQDRSILSGDLTFNNYASKRMGSWQLASHLSMDNILGLSDALHLRFNTNLKSVKRNFSRSFSLYHHLPYGNWSFSSFLNYFSYQYQIQLIHQKAEQSGHTKQTGLKIDYMLKRGENFISSLSVQAEKLINKHYFQNSFVDIQSANLTTLSLGFNHLQLFENKYLFFDLNYEQGLPWFGGMQNQVLQGKFKKWSVELQYQHRYPLNASVLRLHHQLAMHYSRERLPSIKQTEKHKSA